MAFKKSLFHFISCSLNSQLYLLFEILFPGFWDIASLLFLFLFLPLKYQYCSAFYCVLFFFFFLAQHVLFHWAVLSTKVTPRSLFLTLNMYLFPFCRHLIGPKFLPFPTTYSQVLSTELHYPPNSCFSAFVPTYQ